MMALTWRQHRAQLLTAAGLIALLSGYLLFTGHQMASFMTSIGLRTCLSAHGQCDLLAEAFLNRFGNSANVFTLIDLVPLLAGLFWGAPLIARETERGTHRMAWTQSVSRRRWLAVKLAAFTGAAIAAAAVISLLVAWWLRPFNQLMAMDAGGHVNRMAPNIYDLSGIVPAASALFAFALGTAAGALIRRTIPAMAVTLGGYLALRLPLESLRYQFIAPLTAHGHFGNTPSTPLSAYVLSTSYTDAAGHPISFSTMVSACQSTHGGEAAIRLSCLAAKGYQFATAYQPDSRFWTLQGIESAIFVGAAAALLAIASWLTIRRIS
jgi:hypothetical protein